MKHYTIDELENVLVNNRHHIKEVEITSIKYVDLFREAHINVKIITDAEHCNRLLFVVCDTSYLTRYNDNRNVQGDLSKHWTELTEI